MNYVRVIQTHLPGKELRLPLSPHLTIKFLGDVDDKGLEALKAKLSVMKGTKMELRLGGIGVYPSWEKPRVLWVGVEPVDQLMQVHNEVDTLLKDKFPPDEKFHPHITLGRVRDEITGQTVEMIRKLKVEPRTFTLDKLILYRSVLTGQGPVYTEMMKI